MKVISILNIKGGCAKTFTSANMAYELWRRNQTVLMLDNDKQGNLSRSYGMYDPHSIAPSARLISGSWKYPEELICPTRYHGIDLIPSNLSLSGAVWRLAGKTDLAGRYQKLLGKEGGLCPSYDYCIIDNPPDIGLNVINALAVSDEVIVPVKIDGYMMEGLDILAEQIEDARAWNPSLIFKGILITVYRNTDGEKAGLEWLQNRWASRTAGSSPVIGIIRYSKKVSENSFLDKPIYEYSPLCAAAQDYKNFVTAYTGTRR